MCDLCSLKRQSVPFLQMRNAWNAMKHADYQDVPFLSKFNMVLKHYKLALFERTMLSLCAIARPSVPSLPTAFCNSP